jgi:hypothetical protein
MRSIAPTCFSTGVPSSGILNPKNHKSNAPLQVLIALIDIFKILNTNNPKMAIRTLNKYNSNYNYNFVKELPSKFTKINDELIEYF